MKTPLLHTTLASMHAERITVFIPCHSLDDFPTWLEDAETDELLAAWTAAWDPRLLVAAGCLPCWASVDMPPGGVDPLLGIVPPHCEDRLMGMLDATCLAGTRWVRRVAGREAMVETALRALDLAPPTSIAPQAAAENGKQPVTPADFYALGLAWLLGELLARRMRTSTGLPALSAAGGVPDSPFEQSVVRAAQAALAGNHDVARAEMREAYGTLEAARAHYYPVDVWLLDLVLAAEGTRGQRLTAELASPSPWTLVATGKALEDLARREPDTLAQLREACTAGRVAAAGGRYGEEPLDSCAPETIHASFATGHRAWRELLGTAPTTFAQCSGGWSALLPQVLLNFGYSGAIWNLFDGTPLPDPGTSRLRWEGSGGACIDAVARPPLDVRRASAVLALPERIGAGMDHDHTAVIQFAHHAGTASPWFSDLRRIGSWSTLLGTFVAPEEFFRRTLGAGTVVSFEPDAYPISRPDGLPGVPAAEAIPSCMAATATEARSLSDGWRELSVEPLAGPLLAAPETTGQLPPAGQAAPRESFWRSSTRRLFGQGKAARDPLVIEHDSLRLRVHPVSGGVLSIRRPGDRGNRLTQTLALRSTRPAPPAGKPWEDALERAEYGSATADSIERVGPLAIESRGRLTDARGRDAGTFTQRMELLEGLPLARLDITLKRSEAAGGPLLESYAACRFAWNENEDLELRRSLHTQSVATERTLVEAPHFIELLRDGVRHGGPATIPGGMAIFTGGLPWHLRSSPHMLDSLLLVGGDLQGTFRLAIGLDMERPWCTALDLLAAGAAGPLPASLPGNVRLTCGGPLLENGRTVGLRVGLLEVAGRTGDIAFECREKIATARACDAAGRPQEGPEVRVSGHRVSVYLKKYGWLSLDLRFAKE